MRDSDTPTSFSGAYRLYRDAIYSYILLRTNKDMDATEDIVSDTFVKAYEKFDTYNPSYALSTWLYTIARNTLYDYYRKRKIHEPLEEYDFPDTTDPLFEILVHPLTSDELEKAISTLSEQQQICVREKFYNGKSAVDIAREQNLSHDAVRKHLSRAMQDLRSLLVASLSVLLLMYTTLIV